MAAYALGPVGNTPFATNETTPSSSVKSAGSSLIFSLLGSLGAIGVEKVAEAAGSTALPTGIATNPVVVLPTQKAQAAQVSAAQASSTAALVQKLPWIVGGAIGIIGLVALVATMRR